MNQEITLVCLHFLGGSAKGWASLDAALPAPFRAVAVDLPGFGDAADVPGYGVAAMAEHVAGAVRGLGGGRVVLAGHSMGAKVALAVARLAEDGAAGLGGVCGLVLLAGSPPRPEPMTEAKRAEMLGSFAGDAAANRADARRFIADNVGEPALDEAAHEALAGEVLRARRAAWVAWLEGGSKEDWAERVGVVSMPALVLAGTADEALGHDSQRAVMLPHLRDAEMVVLPGAGHLLPMERPGLVAAAIAARFAPVPGLSEAYRALLAGERVSGATRAILEARLAAPAPALGFAPELRAVARAAIGRVVPQEGAARIDLANTVLAAVGAPGDGWRPAVLPGDRAAWDAGLRTLDALGGHFAGQPAAVQDALLRLVAAGDGGLEGHGMLDGAAMKEWFADLRGDAVRHYAAHPATYERMGYAGFAYGGEGTDLPGFRRVGMDEAEAWEPA